MVRSSWKGIYIAKELQAYDVIKNPTIVTKERSSVIIPYYLTKTIYIHNGKKYVGVKITEKSLGRKLGEYSLTKKVEKSKAAVKKTKNK
jgi:small subunit ribosomal protein S19